MKDEINPRHSGAERDHHRFQARLHIRRFGIGERTAAAAGEPVKFGQLRRGDSDQRCFRGTDGRRGKAHVAGGGSTAVDHGQPLPTELAEDDPGQLLGVVDNDGTGQRHRAGESRLGARSEHERLPGAGIFNDMFEHAPVVGQRREGADDAERAILFQPTVEIAQQPERLCRPSLAHNRPHQRLCRIFQRCRYLKDFPSALIEVLRFNNNIIGYPQHRTALRQLEQIDEILPGSRPLFAAPFYVDGAGGGSVDGPTGADNNGVLSFTAVERERRGRAFQRLR